MTYNYRVSVTEDVKNAINEYYSLDEIKNYYLNDNMDELRENLYDSLFMDDSVTGNASGSYTFNTWKAEENLCHNWELINETAECFGIDPVITEDYKNGPEYWDVSIRCYLLSECLDNVLDEITEQFENETEE